MWKSLGKKSLLQLYTQSAWLVFVVAVSLRSALNKVSFFF
jgi:hypothetical protein